MARTLLEVEARRGAGGDHALERVDLHARHSERAPRALLELKDPRARVALLRAVGVGCSGEERDLTVGPLCASVAAQRVPSPGCASGSGAEAGWLGKAITTGMASGRWTQGERTARPTDGAAVLIRSDMVGG